MHALPRLKRGPQLGGMLEGERLEQRQSQQLPLRRLRVGEGCVCGVWECVSGWSSVGGGAGGRAARGQAAPAPEPQGGLEAQEPAWLGGGRAGLVISP